MENGLNKKYGLLTAICMVVGIVVGSGVFFKAQTILQKTEGNMVMGDEPMATRIVNKDGAILIIRWKYAPDYLTVEKLLENDIVTGAEPIEEVEVKWDSTELVLFDSLSPYCEASVKVFLSLQKTSCIIKTYLYQKDEVSLIIHSIQ